MPATCESPCGREHPHYRDPALCGPTWRFQYRTGDSLSAPTLTARSTTPPEIIDGRRFGPGRGSWLRWTPQEDPGRFAFVEVSRVVAGSMSEVVA